jgi:hypothetical protein
MAGRKSTRLRSRSRVRSKKSTPKRRSGSKRAAVREPPSETRDRHCADLSALLGRFADALSFVSTATHTLIAAQDRIDVVTRYDASETLHSLTHGLNELNRVYNELDHTIMELS